MCWRPCFRGGLWAGAALTFLLVFACALSCVALLFWRWFRRRSRYGGGFVGLLTLGSLRALLNMALFQAISGRYQADAAGTVSRGGIWYGLGCLPPRCWWPEPSMPTRVPAILIRWPWRRRFSPASTPGRYATAPESAHPTLRQAIEDFRSPGAVLFAMLLFFQFGNEWSIAGWLPLFLIRRVGLSPSAALMMLALYWFFLMTGRLAAVAILPRLHHAVLLFGSGLAAMFGCLILFLTNNGFGAATGVFFIGAGYASIYPLVAEAIGRRFPYYHPGFFNGIFSLALVGGLIAPATLGYAASAGRGRGDRDSAHRNDYRDRSAIVDLVGVENHRTMKRNANAGLVACLFAQPPGAAGAAGALRQRFAFGGAPDRARDRGIARGALGGMGYSGDGIGIGQDTL